MTLKNALLELRNTINIVDKNLIKLLTKRKQLSINIARIKAEKNYPIKDVEREKTLLKELKLFGKKYYLNEQYIEDLFNIIIHNSVLVQTKWIKKHKNCELPPVNISFLGSVGSYSYLAVQKYALKFSNNFTEKSYKNFYDIITSVEEKESDYAILPIENTSSGLIIETYEILKKTTLYIIDEIYITVDHCLLAKKSTQISKIKKIYSHTQPFKQCSKFIKHFPNWKLKKTTSTSEAINKIINKNDESIAALGNKYYGVPYQLEILAKNISNKKNNTTRFVVLAQKETYLTNKNTFSKTIIFIIKKENDGIKLIKSIFKKYSLFLKELKSYVISKEFVEIIFFIKIKKNMNSYCIKKVLEELKKVIKNIQILGCFPS